MLVAACIALGACGDDSDDNASKAAAGDAGAAPASGCGHLPTPAAKDPDGALAGLPEAQRESFAGYSLPVTRSAWANWKPKHEPPYTVGVVWQPLYNDYQVKNLEALKASLGADPDIGEVITQTTTGLDVPQQIQQVNSLINRKVDLLVVEAISTEALVPASRRAGNAGIPLIEIQGTIPEPHAVNVQYNNYLAAGQTAAQLLRANGGDANLLLVHGIKGIFTDTEAFNGFNAAIKQCPDVEVLGEITGLFQPPATKGETLKFLGTHPQPVDTVLQVGGMSTWIMEAFEQTGRKMPSVSDIAALKGSLGYWINNRPSYEGSGAGLDPSWLGEAVANVARRMLAGQGLKTNVIMAQLPLITGQNLADWADKSWDLKTPGLASGPRGEFLTDPYLNAFFKKGAAPN